MRVSPRFESGVEVVQGVRRRRGTELEDEPLQGTSGSAGASRRSARALQRGSGVQGGWSTSGGEKLGRRPLTCSSAPGRFGGERGRDREGLARGWSWTRAKLLRRLAVTGTWWCGGTAAAPQLGTAGQGERRARVLEWRRRWIGCRGVSVWFKGTKAEVAVGRSGIRIPTNSPVIPGDSCAEPEGKGWKGMTSGSHWSAGRGRRASARG